MTVIVHLTRCDWCTFATRKKDHPSKPHTWMGDEDEDHARRTGQIAANMTRGAVRRLTTAVMEFLTFADAARTATASMSAAMAMPRVPVSDLSESYDRFYNPDWGAA